MAKKKELEVINLPQLNIQVCTIKLVGDTSLIVHRWSEKAKEEIRSKQAKKAKQAKAARDPQADFVASLYPLPDGGYGFPTIGIKACAVGACSHVEGVTKVLARGAFHVNTEMTQILPKDIEPQMREDMVRIGMGVADLRYRGEFTDWHMTLEVRYNANAISEDQIRNLFNTAGFAIGIGEWRPQKNGLHGMFHVE